MSALLIKTICSIIISIMGLIVVKSISGSDKSIFRLKPILLMFFIIMITIFMYSTKYTYLHTIIIYGITIYAYKEILRISFTKSIICCGVMMFSLMTLDLLSSFIFTFFLSADQVRNLWYINISANIIFSVILILIFTNKKIKNSLVKIINKIEHKRSIKIILFFILIMVAISIIIFTTSINYNFKSVLNTNMLLMIILFLLVMLLIGERTSYEKLSDEYDSLFNYVKIFEDWIENEQLNRHEYKNQLAVLRCMTKEKKVKDKIDSIISDNINIDNENINQLKNLPNGGFKGLLYYKIALARNKKINIEIDVNDDVSKFLNKLREEELKVLSKLIGIYVDNAIEASLETKKKIVCLEIYEYDKIVNIVITNSYNNKKSIANRYNKGISTKGKGRGNGLYFANKLLTKNNWILEKQEFIDNFYIQKISIDFKKINKNKKTGEI